MTPELQYLVWGVALLIVHVIVQATLSDLSKGLGWALGPQDNAPEQNVTSGRIQRALRNYLETFPAFAALALVLAVTGLGNETSALGATIWFWARIVYIPAYVSGIPGVRSVAWLTSLVGLVMMLSVLV